jgi:hypothetical protein
MQQNAIPKHLQNKSSMRKLAIGAFGALALATATGAGFLYVGLTDVSADTPHSQYVSRLIEWARESAVERQSREIAPPSDLSDAGRIRRGAGNYHAMCEGCHLAPGIGDSEIRKGLYPQPLNLSLAPVGAVKPDRADARRFWVIKHGLKASGMPAWANAGMQDEAVWDLTAFLKVVPAMSPEQYMQQVETSGGHSHAGMERQGAGHEDAPETRQQHDARPHSHKHGARAP